MNKAFRVFVPVLFSILAFGASASSAFASVTTATGGSAISADTANNSYTTLTGPVIAEGAVADIKSGTITLTAPTGFEFDTSNHAIVTITAGSGTAGYNINNLAVNGTIITTTPDSSHILFTITSQGSSAKNTLTYSNIRVRPTAGTPLASGDITLNNTGIIENITLPVNVGTLTEVAGAAAALEVAAEATAETAVHAYEVALLTTLGQVTTAEGLKVAADSAVALVLDSTANTAFALRVSNQTTAITSARTTLEAAAALASAKTDAHTALNTALTTYTEGNYTAGNWTTLTGFKTTGDTNINVAGTTGDVTTAQNTATTAMAGVQTLAQELAAAKTTAHGVLTDALSTYHEVDYTAENWLILTGFKIAGNSAIDAAIDLAGVSAAQTTATDGMAGVIKLSAITVTAENFNTNKGTDYYGPTVGYALGGTQIANVASVSVALYDASNNLLVTNTSKSAAKVNNTLQGPHYSSAFLIIPGTYSTSSTWNFGNTSALSAGVKPAKAIITITDVNGFTYTAENASFSEVTATWESLFAKTTAKTDVATALGTYVESNYTAGNWTTLNAFHSNGDVAIDAATDLVAVGTAKDAAIAGMVGVVTDLLNAKTSAHDALDIVLANYSQANYTVPNWTTVNSYKTIGDTNIDDAITTDDVTTAQTNATDEMAGVTKLEVNQTKTKTDSNGNGLATIDATTPEVVITNSTQPVIITVETPNATLDLTNLVNLDTGIGTLPQMTITAGNASVEIPNGTTVTAPGWDGILSAPTAGTTSGTAPAGFSVGDTVIEMGSPDHILNFSNAVKITLTGVTGTVGYRPAGSTVWQTIDVHCTSATNYNNIVGQGECSIPDGLGNTVIWTYHFTTFGGFNSIVYGCMDSIATNYNSSATSQTGVTCTYPTVNGSILSFSGSGTPNPLPGVTAATPATGRGQVLGAATYNFMRNLGLGLSGADVTELQKVLIAAGILKIEAPTGNFGQLTKAAVQAFQKSHGVLQTGFVGPLTRGDLNKGAVPTNFTTAQADAILSFLESFGVDASVVANMKASFGR